jgi:hypothetical protein
MGLTTTHGCWNAPYSSFNEFRERLANEIGISLSDYLGYGKGGSKDLSSIDHKIMPLLNHSDCDGMLTPEECKSIADGLNEILIAMRPDGKQYFIYQIVKFRDGCLDAYSRGEEVEFN